jgi:dienelactone hydrolase
LAIQEIKTKGGYMIKTQEITYYHDQLPLKGFYAYEDDGLKKPGILVAHDWSGRNAFACEKAEDLAGLGYVGFALDMYGHGKTAESKEEKSALIQVLLADRMLLQARIAAAYQALSQLEMVDAKKIAAIGFCFGGLCVLDLARSHQQITAVVSFHGLLNAPQPSNSSPINAKILALHGFDDPMVPHQQVIAFGEEMTKAKADWQMHIYGNTLHAFTNPQANDAAFGTVYNKKSDTRSWLAMQNFFEEVL